jgi:hypothetical protein
MSGKCIGTKPFKAFSELANQQARYYTWNSADAFFMATSNLFVCQQYLKLN